MSDHEAGGASSTDTRFKKGQSGNPKGRPPRKPSETPSAFDIIFDKKLTFVEKNGQTQELTVEEALQRKTYDDAFKGNRAARRQVLKWIDKREKARAPRRPPVRSGEAKFEQGDPRNADEAMLILGIATRDETRTGPEVKHNHLLLELWAVQAALRRRGGPTLTDDDISEIKRKTRNGEKLHLPKRSS